MTAVVFLLVALGLMWLLRPRSWFRERLGRRGRTNAQIFAHGRRGRSGPANRRRVDTWSRKDRGRRKLDRTS